MYKTDLAYVAGIIDGEGNILIAKQSNVNYWGCGFYLRIRVSTTDDIIVPWLMSHFGGCAYIHRRDKSKSADYSWYLCSDNAMRFLENILPYLKLKKDQALVAIQFQKQKAKSRHRGRIKHISRELFESEQQMYWTVRKLKLEHKAIDPDNPTQIPFSRKVVQCIMTTNRQPK